MSVPSWCRRGQKVVCIKVGDWSDIGEQDGPRFGDVLTIAMVAEHPVTGECHLGFVEYSKVDFFWCERFVPVVDDDIEASLFRTLKSPSSGAARHLLPQGEKGRRRVPA